MIKKVITPGIYVRIEGEQGHARVETWIGKNNLILLDRKIGGYYTHPLEKVQLLDPSEAYKAMQQDKRIIKS